MWPTEDHVCMSTGIQRPASPRGSDQNWPDCRAAKKLKEHKYVRKNWGSKPLNNTQVSRVRDLDLGPRYLKTKRKFGNPILPSSHLPTSCAQVGQVWQAGQPSDVDPNHSIVIFEANCE